MLEARRCDPNAALEIVEPMYYITYMDATLNYHSSAEIGELVRERRRSQGLTQESLAHAIGVERRAIADLEAGRNVGLHVFLMALARLGSGLAIVPALAGAQPYSRALLALCRTASTSYEGEMPPGVMENFLLTGEAPAKWATHIDYALEESPVLLFEKVIASYQPPMQPRIRHNLRAWAARRHLHVPKELSLA